MLQVTEGRYRLAEFLPECGRALVNRPVRGEIGAVDGQRAAQPFPSLTDRVGVAGCREAPDRPCAILLVGALLLPRDAPGAQQPAQRQAALVVSQQAGLVEPVRGLGGANLIAPVPVRGVPGDAD